MEYLRGARLRQPLTLFKIITLELDWKILLGTNILAYHEHSQITDITFTTLALVSLYFKIVYNVNLQIFLNYDRKQF